MPFGLFKTITRCPAFRTMLPLSGELVGITTSKGSVISCALIPCLCHTSAGIHLLPVTFRGPNPSAPRCCIGLTEATGFGVGPPPSPPRIALICKPPAGIVAIYYTISFLFIIKFLYMCININYTSRSCISWNVIITRP